MLAELPEESFQRVISARGCAVLPGLVDGHTHPVWAGDRVGEFALKLAGASYMQDQWRTLIGPDSYKYCALIGWDLSYHKDTAQGIQGPLPGAFLVVCCVFMYKGCRERIY